MKVTGPYIVKCDAMCFGRDSNVSEEWDTTKKDAAGFPEMLVHSYHCIRCHISQYRDISVRTPVLKENQFHYKGRA